ncbi:hypothetical protein TcWFU_001657 [Taenia crassiceps]|uniref:Uncharacterized protein n=1 Tax=Taenia crassiceps TaxID=6207 RepID=A0ABR4Q6R6_9CEST
MNMHYFSLHLPPSPSTVLTALLPSFLPSFPPSLLLPSSFPPPSLLLPSSFPPPSLLLPSHLLPPLASCCHLSPHHPLRRLPHTPHSHPLLRHDVAVVRCHKTCTASSTSTSSPPPLLLSSSPPLLLFSSPLLSSSNSAHLGHYKPWLLDSTSAHAFTPHRHIRSLTSSSSTSHYAL